MKTATLTRNPSTPESTFGLMQSDTGFKVVTCENTLRRIPSGTYEAELRSSPKHKGLDFGFGRGMVYGLKDVKGRTNIEIHPANWFFQLEGCIAPGSAVAYLQTPDKKLVQGITSSRDAVRALMTEMRGRPFQLIIKDPL